MTPLVKTKTSKCNKRSKCNTKTKSSIVTLPTDIQWHILEFLPVTERRLIHKEQEQCTRPRFLRMCFATVFESCARVQYEVRNEMPYVREEYMTMWLADLMHSDLWKQFPELEEQLALRQ